MKPFFLILLVCLLVSTATFGMQEDVYKTEFFEAAKTYQDKDFVLNDAIEFAVFDMSEVKFINESDEATLQKAKEDLKTLPKYFYQNLKNEVLGQMVPINLYPTTAPAYTRPLALSIKIKSVHLKTGTSEEITPESAPVQTISMRIFGQIEDKKTGEALIKFYDSGSEVAASPDENGSAVYDKISSKLMKNLALFLKSKY